MVRQAQEVVVPVALVEMGVTAVGMEATAVEAVTVGEERVREEGRDIRGEEEERGGGREGGRTRPRGEGVWGVGG